MDDARPMRLVQRVGDLDGVTEALVEWQLTPAKPRSQGLAFEIRHDEECRAGLVADIVERADVRMIELRERPRVALEALAELRVAGKGIAQELERDDAAEARVAGLVHLAHAAEADRRLDFVRAETSSWGPGHVALQLAVDVSRARSTSSMDRK